jgi:hypothetical protein
MNLRISLLVLLALILTGCGKTGPDEKELARPYIKTQMEPLRGLQSLTRVQLQFYDVPDSVRADSVKRLHEQLPQVHMEGSASDWTLEFLFRSTVGLERPPISAGPDRLVPTLGCCCRLSRTATVDGRLVTAIAYEGPVFAATPAPTRPRGFQPLPGESERQKDESLSKAIDGFIEAWRAANPGTKQM